MRSILTPDSLVSIGKFGSFPVNLILGRPFFHTFELSDKENENGTPRLRLVPPSELNAEVLAEDAPASESRAEPAADGEDGFDLVAEDGTVLIKNNRLTIDDASRQTLTMQEIEELKKASGASGKDIIEKIMKSHANLDEKTSFSLAKYTLRKTKKYMRRFTVLPVDVSMLAAYMMTEKEASRTMEIREESLGLIGTWANIHHNASAQPHALENDQKVGGGRWLVVDETGGLIVASMAERMGLLYPEDEEEEEEDMTSAEGVGAHATAGAEDVSMQDVTGASTSPAQGTTQEGQQAEKSQAKRRKSHKTELATTNTIHLLHANAQPNISLLKYFGYDPNTPAPTHHLHNHLKPLSWLQLLQPNADTTYDEPETVAPEVLDTWKSGKRGTYYKKRRRWEKCKAIVDETRQGGFDGLIVVSAMDPSTVLKHTVPLLKGAAHVVVYSPTIEPLTDLADLYSRDRKAAYIAHISEEGAGPAPEEDFPVDPRLLLAPTIQTSKVRQWQVLPGRTHPLMTGRGGAEGYVFSARKVTPVEGKIEARGKFNKKRKIG